MIMEETVTICSVCKLPILKDAFIVQMTGLNGFYCNKCQALIGHALHHKTSNGSWDVSRRKAEEVVEFIRSNTSINEIQEKIYNEISEDINKLMTIRFIFYYRQAKDIDHKCVCRSKIYELTIDNHLYHSCYKCGRIFDEFQWNDFIVHKKDIITGKLLEFDA